MRFCSVAFQTPLTVEGEAMTGRLIVVSNRIPAGDKPSGGLVVALGDTMTRRGGIWIGAHPDTGRPDQSFEEMSDAPFTRLAFRLSAEEQENYYLGFANSVLWPLCHRRGDLVELHPDYERAYLSVNRRLARMIARIIRPDDMVWVHDYHLIPLAADLRRLGVTNRIGFFLHIPCPTSRSCRRPRPSPTGWRSTTSSACRPVRTSPVAWRCTAPIRGPSSCAMAL